MLSYRTLIHVTLFCCIATACVTLAHAAAPNPPTPPDLTAGGERDSTYEFNLGPTGAKAWTWGWHCGAYDARQILITKIADDSPADGLLEVDDVILGVEGKPFSIDARRAFGEAIGRAEVSGSLPLTVWRDGKQLDVTLKLPVIGQYSDTWPYDCPKSAKILEQGCQWIARQELSSIAGDINALTLLASGDPQYMPKVTEYVKSITPTDLKIDFTTQQGHFVWGWGYRLILLCEYYLVTDDQAVLPAVRQYAHQAALSQSRVGSWGHKGAMPDQNMGELHGRLGGYGAVNAAGLPCFIGMVMAAEKCGIQDDQQLNDGIERCRRFFSFFANRGSIPYGFHDPRLVDHDDNGKNCMGAMAFDLLDQKDETRHFARWALASYDSRELGHTGNFFSYLWGPTGVQCIGPKALSAYMQKQQWYYDLARDHNGRFWYQGQAGEGPQNYSRWDCTGAYLLAYAMPKREVLMTGRDVDPKNVMNAKGVADSLRAGEGYNVWDRGHEFYCAKPVGELFDILHRWSPLARQRAAQALATKEGDFTPQLIEMLNSDRMDAKLGACQTIIEIGQPCEGAVDALIAQIDSDDLWLRISAAKALVAIGPASRRAAPKLLTQLANEDPTDTLMVESRFIGEALFKKKGRSNNPGLLAENIDGCDHDELLSAIRYVLTNPNGGARQSVTSLYQTMTLEELKPVMPEILDSIQRPGWSVMFSNGVREDGLKFLSENHIAEGMDRLLELTDPDSPRGNEGYWFAPRVYQNWKHYGSAAKPHLPQLKENLEAYKLNKMIGGNTRFLEEMQQIIDTIQSDENSPEVISWKDI